MVGLLGAGLRRRRARPLPRMVMALICAAAGFAYGLVLNFYTFVTFTGQHTLAQFLVIEGSAFSFDLAHAIGNFVFYLAFGPALVRALQRFRLRMDVAWGPVTAAPLVLLALLGAAAVGLPADRAQASTAVPQPALVYLARVQNADGGFGLSPGQQSSQLASAWVVIALAAAGRNPAELRRDTSVSSRAPATSSARSSRWRPPTPRSARSSRNSSVTSAATARSASSPTSRRSRSSPGAPRTRAACRPRRPGWRASRTATVASALRCAATPATSTTPPRRSRR
jgi:energy-coupling factor transport system substrate-specific component